MSGTATPPRRILVVANETVASDILHVAIRAQAHAAAGSQVLVVAPALNPRMRHWLSDDDDARLAARLRLESCLDRLVAAGVDAEGLVGDADPVQAVEDALRVFRADSLVISTHPEGRSNWLARDLVARATDRFGLPTTHIVVDSVTGSATLASSGVAVTPTMAAA
jgi:hypothetical protein